MKINIVSSDKRYIRLNELMKNDGYNSKVCTPNDCDKCDCIVLSVRNEFDDGELSELFSNTEPDTLVLCGNKSRVENHFLGRVVDYSNNEYFLQKNADLTAEATISYLHSLTKESLNGKSVFISGYGRIGKSLCKLLKSLGCNVSSFARRQEIIEQMTNDGIKRAQLDMTKESHIIINTVPAHIFTKALIDKIPKDAYIVELASHPYGFECMDRVEIASGLPGKILTESGALAVYDTIKSILSSAGKE